MEKPPKHRGPHCASLLRHVQSAQKQPEQRQARLCPSVPCERGPGAAAEPPPSGPRRHVRAAERGRCRARRAGWSGRPRGHRTGTARAPGRGGAGRVRDVTRPLQLFGTRRGLRGEGCAAALVPQTPSAEARISQKAV